jgi:hypothetical protein
MKNKKIDVEIVSKDMKLWKELQENTERQLEGLNKSVQVNEAILSMALTKYKEAEIEWKKTGKKQETTQNTSN